MWRLDLGLKRVPLPKGCHVQARCQGCAQDTAAQGDKVCMLVCGEEIHTGDIRHSVTEGLQEQKEINGPQTNKNVLFLLYKASDLEEIYKWGSSCHPW